MIEAAHLVCVLAIKPARWDTPTVTMPLTPAVITLSRWHCCLLLGELWFYGGPVFRELSVFIC